jgi:hypothetical protein
VSAEAAAKRLAAMAAAERAGREALVTADPATVRWLLCGRGRPVVAGGGASDYTLVLTAAGAWALHQDIETSRVVGEEHLDELGWAPHPYPWHEGPEAAVADLLGPVPAASHTDAEPYLAPARRRLSEPERRRYAAAGAAAAAAMAETLPALAPTTTEREAAAELAFRALRARIHPPVLLVAGAARQGLHRHPLATDAPLGAHALVAISGERDGLWLSLTRIVSFGPPPGELVRLVRRAAAVDAAMILASRPGAMLGDAFAAGADAYAAAGVPDEWRRHHQGGLTGYRGREVFAVPGDPTPFPESFAVAWNPSITGGAKSEDTVLVDEMGTEVITRTPSLPELHAGGLPRPAIIEL